jgi:Putative MetA-pathway of phenol degradation
VNLGKQVRFFCDSYGTGGGDKNDKHNGHHLCHHCRALIYGLIDGNNSFKRLPSRSEEFMKFIILFGSLIFFAHAICAQPAPPDAAGISEGTPPKQVDRSQYNLFNPTPYGQMRDFMPDRPNVTDGPYTVDPGHWLLEVGLFEYTRDRYNSTRIRLDSFASGDTNIRLGITSYAEVDLLFTTYNSILTTDKDTGARLSQSGFSDITLRSKINLLGNDGGPLAIGLIPFVTFPSGADGLGNRGFEGGLGFPVQFALPADFLLGLESTIQTIHEPGGGSHFDYLNSLSLGHAITKKLSTYVELATDLSTTAHSSWIGTVDTALIYQPVNNWQLDAGVNIGVTKPANDLFTFIGAAWRY